MEDEMKRSDVLIIGAGPTGLVLALWLTELGVKVRIVDKTAEPGTRKSQWSGNGHSDVSQIVPAV
jgi:2-polyprenyl-6-methoxyphenol hydroxylase-like FAD-dependent oxidoreductase